MESCSDVQMCSGHEGGCEAAIHAMKEVFEAENSEAALLVDAANAFNNINRQSILHNIRIICPILATYVNNCYKIPARLFIIGGKEIKSKEGTTQGDPLGMFIYAIGITPLLEILVNVTIMDNSNMVAFADDVTAVGQFEALRKWWDYIVDVGPKFGYQPQPAKSWLIVKNDKIKEAKQHFQGTHIQITATGERHLGAVIGSKEYRAEYCKNKIQDWIEEINVLSEVAVTEPQAAYACFVSGYQHKFTYYIRTIPEIEEYLQPLEEVIRHRFLPAITGGHIVTDQERQLISLPPRFGGLGIKVIKDVAKQEYNNSQKMTASLKNLILGKTR